MTYEYTTASKVASELRTTQNFSTTTVPTLADVTTLIQEISDEVNQLSGRIYGATPYSETFDYNGADTLVLRNAPLLTVTSVLYSSTALGTDTYSLSDTKVENKEYTIYKDEGELEILFGNWSPQIGLKRIQVNYTAGFSVIPGNIQMLTTKLVAKRVLDSLINKDINEKQSGKSVSVGSISIVKPADFGVSQYKTLASDLETLKKEVVGGSGVYRLPLNRY